jgi:hypothetical protein
MEGNFHGKGKGGFKRKPYQRARFFVKIQKTFRRQVVRIANPVKISSGYSKVGISLFSDSLAAIMC